MLTSKAFFTKEFAINHDKELDKADIYCKIKNIHYENIPEVKSKLFFNKEMLPLGQVFIRVEDQIKFSFHVENFQEGAPESPAFAEYIFEVEADGFRKISGQCKDNYLGDIRTWKTATTYLDLNYIDDGSFGLTTLHYN